MTDHRRLAVDLFNHVWTLLERTDRTPEHDDEMLHAAHASRYHWSHAGTTINLARGEWQCSRVYATLGRAEPALHHALRCLDYTEAADEREDWDLPFAHEAIARAFMVAGDDKRLRDHARRARELAAPVAEDDDRAHLLSQLADLRE